MDPKLKKLWIEDLRAGHPQTTGYLKDERGHCCLGRLAEVMVANDLVPDGHKVIIHDDCIIIDNGHTCILPEDFVAGIGVTVEARNKCFDMNDDEGRPFPEIADWIEQNL